VCRTILRRVRLTRLLRPPSPGLRAEIVARDAVIAALEARISQLDGHVVELQARLRANSSKPPSADGLAKGPPKPSRAARRAAARRKPGGQAGAPGAHLAQVEYPDVVVVHAPGRCGRCGGELADAPMVGAEVRQVHDLPQCGLLVTEHRAERRRCGCGAVTAAAFPEGCAPRPATVLGSAPRPAICTASSTCRSSAPPRRWPTWSAPEVASGTVAAILGECAEGLDAAEDQRELAHPGWRAALLPPPQLHFDRPQTAGRGASCAAPGVRRRPLAAGRRRSVDP